MTTWRAAINKACISLLAIVACPAVIFAIGQPSYVEDVPSDGCFAIAQGNNTASLHVDGADWPGAIRAANDLQSDIARVTGTTPPILRDKKTTGELSRQRRRHTLMMRCKQFQLAATPLSSSSRREQALTFFARSRVSLPTSAASKWPTKTALLLFALALAE